MSTVPCLRVTGQSAKAFGTLGVHWDLGIGVLRLCADTSSQGSGIGLGTDLAWAGLANIEDVPRSKFLHAREATFAIDKVAPLGLISWHGRLWNWSGPVLCSLLSNTNYHQDEEGQGTKRHGHECQEQISWLSRQSCKAQMLQVNQFPRQEGSLSFQGPCQVRQSFPTKMETCFSVVSGTVPLCSHSLNQC